MPMLSTPLLHVESIMACPMLELLRLGGSHLPCLGAAGTLNSRAGLRGVRGEGVVPTLDMHGVAP